MKTSTSHRIILGTLAIALLGGLAWVALRTGPLAPVKIQTARITTGSVAPELFGSFGYVEGYGKLKGTKGGGTWVRTNVFAEGSMGTFKSSYTR